MHAQYHPAPLSAYNATCVAFSAVGFALKEKVYSSAFIHRHAKSIERLQCCPAPSTPHSRSNNRLTAGGTGYSLTSSWENAPLREYPYVWLRSKNRRMNPMSKGSRSLNTTPWGRHPQAQTNASSMRCAQCCFLLVVRHRQATNASTQRDDSGSGGVTKAKKNVPFRGHSRLQCL